MKPDAADSRDSEVVRLSTMSSGKRTNPGRRAARVGGGVEAVGTTAPSSRAISVLDGIFRTG